MEVMQNVCMKENYSALQVKWPSVDEMKESAALLENNRILEPLLMNALKFVDAVRHLCANYIDSFKQKRTTTDTKLSWRSKSSLVSASRGRSYRQMSTVLDVVTTDSFHLYQG